MPDVEWEMDMLGSRYAKKKRVVRCNSHQDRGLPKSSGIANVGGKLSLETRGHS